jgi:uncharacterized protein
MPTSPPSKLTPIEQLQENASQKFSLIYEKFRSEMKCGPGCSKCCEVDLGVSVVEAERLVLWFAKQPESIQSALKEKWRASPLTKNQKNCAFLVSNQCSVYEARPIICRTQGAPLEFDLRKDEKGVDACSLNFTQNGIPQDRMQWIDLERLNALISIANQAQKSELPEGLSSRVNREKRVLLRDLREYFLGSIGGQRFDA